MTLRISSPMKGWVTMRVTPKEVSSLEQESFLCHELGVVEMQSKILLSDPCYYYNPSDPSMVAIKCAEGSWHCTFLYTESIFECGCIRPRRLIATSELFEDGAAYHIVKHPLSVDSATLGIFNLDDFPALICNEKKFISKESR